MDPKQKCPPSSPTANPEEVTTLPGVSSPHQLHECGKEDLRFLPLLFDGVQVVAVVVLLLPTVGRRGAERAVPGPQLLDPGLVGIALMEPVLAVVQVGVLAVGRLAV